MNVDKAKVVEVVAKAFHVDPERITDDTDFEKEFETGEIGRAVLALDLMSEFGVDIPPADDDKFTSLRAVVEYLEALPDQK
jgi:acyl carrier protein